MYKKRNYFSRSPITTSVENIIIALVHSLLKLFVWNKQFQSTELIEENSHEKKKTQDKLAKTAALAHSLQHVLKVQDIDNPTYHCEPHAGPKKM